MTTKTNSPTPWDGLSPCDAYEVGYQHGGYDAGQATLTSQSARIAELEAFKVNATKSYEDATRRIAELEGALRDANKMLISIETLGPRIIARLSDAEAERMVRSLCCDAELLGPRARALLGGGK